jgi:lactate racemase
MRIAMPYGNSTLEADLEGGCLLATLDVRDAPPLTAPGEALRGMLEQPIGMDRPALADFKTDDTTAIVVSDSFRKTGVHLLLPALIEALGEKAIAEEQIFFAVATGTHRGPDAEETAAILGPELYDRFRNRIMVHDPDDETGLVTLGTTRRGTPVRINRRVTESDRVIVTGAVVLHYFGGFGGGRKALVPGLAARATIARNHALNLAPDADRLNPAVRIGVMDGNPVAEDMIEAARMCRCDFIVNTVLNPNGEIAGLFTGELEAAHREAAAFARRLYTAEIPEKADLVIATAGDARNFLQSHKALFNAWQALKPGGRIIFLTESPEGFGGNRFEEWLRLGSTEKVIRQLRRNAEINGQTALSTLEKAPAAWLVTQLDEEAVRLTGARKAASFQEGINGAIAELRRKGIETPACYLMPAAAWTVPRLRPGLPPDPMQKA